MIILPDFALNSSMAKVLDAVQNFAEFLRSTICGDVYPLKYEFPYMVTLKCERNQDSNVNRFRSSIQSGSVLINVVC
jgi:hypothetical protein